MGLHLCWEPVNRKKHSISSASPSLLIEIFARAFGSRFPKLDQDDVPILKGILAAQHEDGNGDALQGLIDAVEQFGEIKVEAEY